MSPARHAEARGPGRLAAAALAALAGFGLVAGIFPIFESDLFWHLAAGRWILEQGEIPRLDPFRFGSGALPWIDHEWLFQVVLRGAERAAGLDGLIVLRAAALAGFALLLHAVARRRGLGPGLAALVALGATLGVRPRFLLRPEIVTLYGIVLLLAGLDRWCGTRSRRLLVALVALTVAWVNFHGEALLAPPLALAFLLGARWRGGTPGAWRTVAGLPALLALALLANPYGWRLLEVPRGIFGALAGLPAHNPEWMSALEAPQPYLFGGLAAAAALALLARARTGRWAAPEWGLPALALAVLALGAVRHQALFYAAAAPYAAACLAALGAGEPAGARRERGLTLAAIALALLAAVWCAAPPARGPLRARHGGLAWGFGLAPGRFPVRMAGVLAAHPEVGPLYNELVHGGYLLWRLYPSRRVFLDGRMELEPELLGAVARARTDAGAWRALLERRGAVGALVRYEPKPRLLFEPDPMGVLRPVGERTPNAILFPPELWDLVDWDDEAMLFLRRDAVRPVGSWQPYRHVHPEDVGWTLLEAASDPAFRARALAEIERKLSQQPDCRRARRLADQLSRVRWRYEERRRDEH